MAKDPAFLFYPGDYLRDTQCLSEPVQVAYDRIMCEHMRNICISKERLKFFTKRLSPDEMGELMSVLKEIEGGYQIEWVAESVAKRRLYSESRRNNRESKSKNISSTYVKHMENEIENEIIDDTDIELTKTNTREKKNKIPEYEEFENYAREKYPGNFSEISASLRLKYLAWVEAGWKDGYGKPIKNWKAKLLNTLPHLKIDKNAKEPRKDGIPDKYLGYNTSTLERTFKGYREALMAENGGSGVDKDHG